MFSNQFCFGKEIVGWAKSSSETNEKRKEILAEAAKGLTTNQMAEKLFISPHTVESHRKILLKNFKRPILVQLLNLL